MHAVAMGTERKPSFTPVNGKENQQGKDWGLRGEQSAGPLDSQVAWPQSRVQKRERAN